MGRDADLSPSSGAAPRLRRSTADVRRALCDAAVAAFAAHGYAGASTKDIAHAAGTSETSIYRHFGSKVGLFSAAVAEPFCELLAEYERTFTAQLDEPWDDARLMRAFLGEFFEHLRSRREAVRALVSAAGDRDAGPVAAAVAERLNGVFARLEVFARERAERVGGYSPALADVWLRLLAGMVTSLTLFDRWFVPPGWEGRDDELLDVMTDLALHGILGSTLSPGQR